jgi:hypothetical protein
MFILLTFVAAATALGLALSLHHVSTQVPRSNADFGI